jgi:protein-disulfide isomerase
MPDMSSSTNPTPPKSNSQFFLLLPLVFFLGLGAGYLLWGHRTAEPVETSISGTRRVNVAVGNSPSIGPENAPITLVEFGDYQCPYCKLWYDTVYDRLLASYPGKIRFVYRDFPLNGHPEALPAAEAADCAGDQNAYWNYFKALFGEQYGLGRDAYIQYATDLKLNVSAFTACLDSHHNQAKVKDNLSYAIGLGVQSTPSFFINGIPVIGAEPFETFQQIIDQELAGKNQ